MNTHDLTYADVAALLRYEGGKIFWRVDRGGVPAGTEAGGPVISKWTDGRIPYRRVRINKHTFMTANIVFLLCKGRWPASILDHQDGNPSNNRITNLREVTPSENSRNIARPKNNTSGTIGVYFFTPGQKWCAYIGGSHSIGGQQRLGYYETKEDAIAARKAAERSLGFHPNHGRAIL